MIERVVGPMRGYFVAVYVAEMGELGEEFLPFYKIFRDRPRDYWQSGHVSAMCLDRRFAKVDEAVAQTLEVAGVHMLLLSEEDKANGRYRRLHQDDLDSVPTSSGPPSSGY